MRPLLISALVIFTAFACTHEIPTVPDEDPVDPEDPKDSLIVTELKVDSTCDANKVYFVNDIFPILQNSCAYSGCHDAMTSSDKVDLSSYDAILNSDRSNLLVSGDPDKSRIYEVIEDNEMPLSGNPLSSTQKQLFFDWITQGAEYNECLPDQCDTASVTYSNDISGIISTYCQGCHSGASAQKEVVLSDYTSLKSHVDTGKVRDAILGINGVSLMPQGNALPDCELNKFLKWIDDGAPNN